MKVNQERSTRLQPRGTDETYLLRVDLFDSLMRARGNPNKSEQARMACVGRSTLRRLRKREVEATLGVAMRLAKLASTTVETLFEPVTVGE